MDGEAARVKIIGLLLSAGKTLVAAVTHASAIDNLHLHANFSLRRWRGILLHTIFSTGHMLIFLTGSSA